MVKYKLKDCKENIDLNRRSINGFLLEKTVWLELDNREPKLDYFIDLLDVDLCNTPLVKEIQTTATTLQVDVPSATTVPITPIVVDPVPTTPLTIQPVVDNTNETIIPVTPAVSSTTNTTPTIDTTGLEDLSKVRPYVKKS